MSGGQLVRHGFRSIALTPIHLPPLLRRSAYYLDGRDYDDCLAALYDWEDLTEQVQIIDWLVG